MLTFFVVAQSFERRWVMIEREAEYTALARERLARVHVPLPEELIAPAHHGDGDGHR